ncbi:uncharacterized protein LOC116346063 [Contarinia nasturtii]|uniref:uncharacterized protein LOC116346063 n=1 Tax=Contarinia nasturtii TaxID=265458 RepID=UPI0012D41A28|nr:uncharacterized protein LOC116346063 [Contarinia nasturtii]
MFQLKMFTLLFIGLAIFQFAGNVNAAGSSGSNYHSAASTSSNYHSAASTDSNYNSAESSYHGSESTVSDYHASESVGSNYPEDSSTYGTCQSFDNDEKSTADSKPSTLSVRSESVQKPSTSSESSSSEASTANNYAKAKPRPARQPKKSHSKGGKK